MTSNHSSNVASFRGTQNPPLGILGRTTQIMDVIVFSGLLVLMFLAVIPYGTVDAWWESAFESGMFALTALWLIQFGLSGRIDLKRLLVVVPLILLTAFAYLQAVSWGTVLPAGLGRLTAQRTLTIDRYQTFLTARKLLALTLFFGLLLQLTSSSKRLRWVVRMIVAAGLASAIFAILRQLIQLPDSPSGFVLPFLFYGVGYGQFVSPNPFAYLMEMPFGLVLGLILGGGLRRKYVLIYAAILVAIWTALVASNSRGGLIGMTIQCFFVLSVALGWFSARRLEDGGKFQWLGSITRSRVVRVVGILIIVVAVVAAVFWMGGESLNVKLTGQPEVEEVANTRRAMWHSSWEMIKQNPWTGVGFGAYFLGITKYQYASGKLKLEQAHNDYLDLIANGGVVALVLVAAFVGLIVWRARRSFASQDPYRRAAALGAAAGILSVAVHSLVDFGLQLTGIAVVFAALIVVLIADGVGSGRKKPSAADFSSGTQNPEKAGSPGGRAMWQRIVSVPLIVVALFACALLIRSAYASGLSRLLQTGAIVQARLEPADKAVSLTPADPEAHYTRGLTLANQQKLDEAVNELRTAISLRPFHYYQWLDLGVTLDRVGDQAGAYEALTQSVRLAPTFAQPRWQLGNFMFRQGRIDEAFVEMRSATRTNPNLFGGMLGFAWAVSNGDVPAFIKMVEPITSRNHLELGKFLAGQGNGAEAARELQIAGVPTDQISIDLWRQTVYLLISTNQFSAAYTAWAAGRSGAATDGPRNAVLNGDFIEPVIKDDLGFGWQLSAVTGVSASIDPTGPDPKSRSLLLNFNGDFAPDTKPLYQIVLVEPQRRYSLSFMVRTEGVVSAGPPAIFVLDSSGKTQGPLGHSEPLSGQSAGWKQYSLDFSTDQNTSAVTVSLQRLPCNESPCPLFGKLWLSGVKLRQN